VRVPIRCHAKPGDTPQGHVPGPDPGAFDAPTSPLRTAIDPVLAMRPSSPGITVFMPSQLQSPEIQAFASGLPLTLMHAAITLVMLVLGTALYCLLTPHREIKLIREGNAAAALSLGGVMVGLAIPLATSLSASVSPLEIVLWGVSTIAVQLLVFRITDMLLKGLPERISEGEVAAAALLVGAKVATALILAAAVAG
jgi:putative membrane protein